MKTKPRNCSRISSVGKALDCRAEGRVFDSRGRTNTQGLRNEGTPFTLQAARPSRVSDDYVKGRSRPHLETVK